MLDERGANYVKKGWRGTWKRSAGKYDLDFRRPKCNTKSNAKLGESCSKNSDCQYYRGGSPNSKSSGGGSSGRVICCNDDSKCKGKQDCPAALGDSCKEDSHGSNEFQVGSSRYPSCEDNNFCCSSYCESSSCSSGSYGGYGGYGGFGGGWGGFGGMWGW